MGLQVRLRRSLEMEERSIEEVHKHPLEYPLTKRESTPVSCGMGQKVAGSVYMVPDTIWSLCVVGRSDHPGACTSCEVRERRAVLVKGTDAENGRRGYRQVVLISGAVLFPPI